MADGDRERVGGVIGARLVLEREQHLDHPRHLVLLRASAAAHRALDLLGGVAAQGKPALAGGEHRHAARLPDGEGGAHVLAEVELLERKRVGVVLVEQLLDGARGCRPAGAPGGALRGVWITPPSSATRRPPRRATTP